MRRDGHGMERRGFLKGLFGGVTAAGLVVAASPSEIATFAAPLVKDAPIVLDVAPSTPARMYPGEHLYNAAGDLVAIVTALDLHVDQIDVTMASDANRVYLPGRRHVDIRAAAVGPVEWDSQHAAPRLRGVSIR